MKNKIDKYFKEKLDVPQLPPKDAWENIQNRISKKEKKRRIIPIWGRISGIAVSLLLMVSFGYWLGTQNAITLQTQQEDPPGFAVSPNDELNDNQNQQFNSVSEQNSNYDLTNQNSTPTEFGTSSNGNTSTNQYSTNSVNDSYLLADNSNYKLYKVNSYSNLTNKEDERIIQNDKYINHLDVKSSHYEFNLIPVNATRILSIEDALINKNIDKEVLLASLKSPKQKQEKDKKKKKHIDFDRFHLSGFVSPLALNTFVGNSMLSDEMSQYKTENSITLAYGIKAAYALSPVLKIRTGVSMVGLEQITKDVPLAVEVTERSNLLIDDPYNNVKYTGNLMIDNQPAVNSLVQTDLVEKMGQGNIMQQIKYVEIPVEAELSLFQTSSIGISAVGGGSTWLLSKNKIYVQTDDYTQELGEANNLNDVSFSANAGLKFDMKLSETLKINVEPNFKYMINPVNNIEKFNPYTVGVNAGLSISFK